MHNRLAAVKHIGNIDNLIKTVIEVQWTVATGVPRAIGEWIDRDYTAHWLGSASTRIQLHYDFP